MTRAQIRMMEKLENGLVWEWHKDKESDEILRYLFDLGYCASREDIRRGWITLAEAGRAELNDIRAKESESKTLAQAAREAAEQARKDAFFSKAASVVAILISLAALLHEILR